MTPDALIEALADLVAERLARRASPDPDGAYDGFHLPPDCPSRERFNRLAKGLPGAVRRGRIWSVPRAVWDEARRRKGEIVIDARKFAQEVAKKVLADAGYRRTA